MTNLHSVATDLHDDSLTTTDDKVDKAEGKIVEDTLENVEGIINNSGVKKVENAHYHKDIEHIR